MSETVFSVANGTVGDGQKVYDLSLLLHTVLSHSGTITDEQQAALTWLTCDLMDLGQSIVSRGESLFPLARRPVAV